MRLSLLPLVLLVVPLSEIGVFILVGSQIGVLATLALVVVTAIIGTILLRVQGLGVLTRIQATLQENRVPGRDLVHGVMILVAGLLLLTPGFVTDSLGFILFVPAVREAGWRFLRERIVVRPMAAPAGRQHSDPDVIDLDPADYESGPARDDSPWRPGRD